MSALVRVCGEPGKDGPDFITRCTRPHGHTGSHLLMELRPVDVIEDREPPCPCECNAGGFCGGCGHAGCGGRR